jgi:hypothetical protein
MQQDATFNENCPRPETDLSSNTVYVVGGQQENLVPLFARKRKFYGYNKGIILKLNLLTGSAENVCEYVSPDESRAKSGSMLFKAASIKGDLLYVCTTTEVLILSLPLLQRIRYISHPMFNDVHHVTPTPYGTVAVANSGLDSVVELSFEGKVLRLFNTLGEDPWSRFSPDTDYRPLDTKPHKSHPNFVFFIDDEMWATRFHQQDAISLSNPGRRIDIAVGRPHDGHVRDGHIYFTTTNGFIVIANKQTLKIDERIDLNSMHRHGRPLGWNRGLLFDGNKMWVGFSRLRPTKWKENVGWVKRGLKWRLKQMLPESCGGNGALLKRQVKNELPTRLVCYDLLTRECLREINLEPYGVSAVYTLFATD